MNLNKIKFLLKENIKLALPLLKITKIYLVKYFKKFQAYNLKKKIKILSGTFAVIAFSLNFGTIQYKTSIFFKQYELSGIKTSVLDIKKENSILESSLKQQILEYSELRQQECIKQDILDKEIAEGHILEEVESSTMEVSLGENKCDIKKITNESIKDIISSFNELLKEEIFSKDSTKGDIHLSDILKEKTKKLKDKEINKIDKNNDKGFDYKGIAKKDLKAIFCVYGHGLSSNLKRNDNGAYSVDGKYSERTFVVPVMDKICGKLKSKFKGTGTKIYSIGSNQEKMSLEQKSERINWLAKKHGFDETNSILVSLHLNKSTDLNRSGIQVFYSTDEIKFGAKGFAGNMMKNLRTINNFGNLYTATGDRGRFKRGYEITSRTKPLSLLIEYGFISNKKDINFITNNQESISDSIVNGITSYLK